MRKRYWLFFWLTAIFLLFVFNGSLPITDSVEGNYSLSAKEMLLTGDWISPQIYGKYWFDKPVFSYWMIALGFKLFGFSEFGARFFPSLFGLLGLWLTVWTGKKLYSSEVGLFSGVLLLMTMEFFTISKSVLTDGMLFFFMNGVLVCYYLAYSGKNKRYYYGSYALAGLATLTKGPIGFLLPGLIIVLFLCWRRDWRSLRQAKLGSGLLLFLLIVAPWYVTMAQLHPDFLQSFLGTQNVFRATVAEHPQYNVPWYYIAVNLLNAYAWIGLLPGMVYHLFHKADRLELPSQREGFLFLWASVIFLFFTCMVTKYITYTYPLLLPLCVLMAAYIWKRGRNLPVKGMLTGNLLFYGALTVFVFNMKKWAPTLKLPGSDMLLYFFLIYFLCMVVLAFHQYKGKSSMEIFTTIMLLTVAFHICSLELLAKPLMADVSGKAAAQVINRTLPQNVPIYVQGGGYPTSTVFYTGRTLTFLVPDDRVEEFKPRDGSWAVKNIMPWTTYGDLYKTNGQAMVLVDTHTKQKLPDLTKTWPGTWKKIKLQGQWSILVRER